MDSREFSWLRLDTHRTPEELQALTGISRRTWYRYQHNPPPWLVLLLRLLAGNLGLIHPAWQNWTINKKGELCSPFNDISDPGRVLSIHWRQQQISALQARVRQLETDHLRKDDSTPSMRL